MRRQGRRTCRYLLEKFELKVRLSSKLTRNTKQAAFVAARFRYRSSAGRTRTYNPSVNSRRRSHDSLSGPGDMIDRRSIDQPSDGKVSTSLGLSFLFSSLVIE